MRSYVGKNLKNLAIPGSYFACPSHFRYGEHPNKTECWSLSLKPKKIGSLDLGSYQFPSREEEVNLLTTFHQLCDYKEDKDYILNDGNMNW